MADLLDSSTNVVMGLLVSVILVCSALVPVALKQIDSLKTFVDEQKFGWDTNIDTYTTLIGVVIILAILGLLIGVVRTYTKTGEVD